MSIRRTGPAHNWFSWRPVRTDYYGWVWLRTVIRARVFLDVPYAQDFWEYTLAKKA